MANPQKGEVIVQVDAGEFVVVFTLGALSAIEGQFQGRSFQDVLSELSATPQIDTLIVVVWAALKRHHPMSIADVGDLVTLSEMSIWGAKIAEALKLAQPTAAARGRGAHPRKAADS